MKICYSFLPENWLRLGHFIAFALFLTFSLQAQTRPAKQWDRTLGSGDGESLRSVWQTSDGGYILGGTSLSNMGGDKTQPSRGPGYTDYWVVKLDSIGNKTWDRTLGGNLNDNLFCLKQTSDGGYIMGGQSWSSNSGDKTQPTRGATDFWVVKLDSSGNKMWDKTLGSSDVEGLTSLQQTADGGYILGGISGPSTNGDKTGSSKGLDDYWVIKLDPNGNKIWDKTFGGSNIDILSTIQQTSDGGYILGGTSDSGIGGDKSHANKGGNDYWVVKIDATGNKIWDRTFGGSGIEWLNSLQQTSDGGYILGGQSNSGINSDKTQASKGDYDFWIIKLDALGNNVWDKTIGGSFFDGLYALQQTSDGGYMLGGQSDSGISGDKSQAHLGMFDYWVVKLDTTGSIVWDKTLGGTEFDRFTSLHQAKDGGYIIGGWSSSGVGFDKSQPIKGGQGFSDYWVVKLAPFCADLKLRTTLASSCDGSVTVNISGLQQGNSGTTSWSLTYTVNGVNQTASGTAPTFALAQNATQGSVYSLVSIVSGTCTTNLSNSLTVPLQPTAPGVIPGSNCIGESVTLSATGAPTGGGYVWYNVATGGTALQASSSGVFTTPNLSATTTYYVAATNQSGCESSRTPVTATIKTFAVDAGINETICANGSPVQLTGFSPVGGIWSGIGVSVSGVFTPNNSLLGNQTLTYTVAQNGCTSSATKQVTLKTCPPPIMPNIITRNNDGKNDSFKPQYLPDGKWQLQIYNRWGVKLFESEDYQHNWPNSKIVDGTYYYLLRNPETEQQFKGWVEVVH